MMWNLFRSRQTRTFRPANTPAKRYRLVLEELEDRRLLSTFTWINTAGGDFNNAANWRDQNGNSGVPSTNDEAIIDMTGINITSTRDNAVNHLLCSATLMITGGTFSIGNVGVNSNITTLSLTAGTLQVNTDTLFISAGTSASTLLAGSGATITFGNSQFTMNPGSSLTGAGIFFVAGGTFTFNTNVSAPANFQLGGGTLNGTGTFTIANAFTWSGGSFDGSGTTTFSPTSTLNITGDTFNKLVTGGHVLNLNGMTTWTGMGELDGSPGSVINNNGTFTVQTDAASGSGGAGGGLIFNNLGTFTKSGTTGTTAFQGNVFNNSGTVNIQSGTLSVSTNYNQTAGTTTVAAGATLASNGTVGIQGGTLGGTGTVNADVYNAGTLAIGSSTGTLTITGNYTQTAAGTLNIKIAASNQFDTIAVGKAAKLAGTLNVSLLNNFAPTAGLNFKILTFTSDSGDFATKTGLAISSNLSFNPALDPTDYTLVVSAPNPGILQFSAGSYLANVSSGMATVTVVRNGGSQGAVSVHYATSDGSAMAGVSYTATSGTLNFADGVTTQMITIAILPTAAGRGNLTVNVTLSGVTGGATLGNPSAVFITLVDDTQHIQSGQLQFAAPAFSANVTSGSAVITVSRTNGSTGTVSVQYATSDGTAQAGVRYTATSGTLTFADGVTSQSFTIPLLNPSTVHGNQTVNLTLSNPTGGATLGTQTTAILTLVDNNQSVQAGQLQFPATSFSANVTSGNAVITVSRVNGSTGTVSVQYATSDGTAQAGVRYTATSGTLTFADGVTSQSFTIPLLNPSTVHGNQTVNLTLSNATGGATLGSPVSAILTIIDNNPVVTVGDDVLFVSGLYHDILGRAADAGGLANFQQAVDTSRSPVHQQFASSFVTLTENRTNLVVSAYNKYLGRTASTTDINGWVTALQQGLTAEQLTTAFVSSPEYFLRQHNDNSTWLNQAYQDILGRAPDPGSQVYLTLLNNQTPLSVVANILVTSTEYRTRLITQVYATYLQRQVFSSDLQAWLPVVSQPPAGPGKPSPDEQFLIGVLGSPEYFLVSGNTETAWTTSLYTKLLGRSPTATEFANTLAGVLNGFAATRQTIGFAFPSSVEGETDVVVGYYQQFLGRTPSASEVAGWVNALESGATREQVTAAFTSSPEYFLIHGNNNTSYVNQLYLDLLGRARGSTETGYIDALNNHTLTLAQVANIFVQSQEYFQHLVNQFYSTALGRQASATEAAGWVQLLQQGKRDELVLSFFLGSNEYFLRSHTYP